MGTPRAAAPNARPHAGTLSTCRGEFTILVPRKAVEILAASFLPALGNRPSFDLANTSASRWDRRTLRASLIFDDRRYICDVPFKTRFICCRNQPDCHDAPIGHLPN